MGRKTFSLLIIGLTSVLFGCIADFTPQNSTIELLPGESQTFTATSDEESANMVWYLDDEQVAYDTTQYEFVAEQLSNGEPIVHHLKAREENTPHQRIREFLGLPNVHDSVTWTIRILPPTGPVTCYLDEDGDGYGDIAKKVVSETPSSNCVDNSDDCDDSKAEVNPGAEEQCDGVDNDCDGILDPEGCCTNGDTHATTCGLGECASTGVVTCVDGAWDGATDTCTPGLPSVEVCDGLDNDCNGSVDDGIEPLPTNCGMGECARIGVAACVDGAMIDNCVPGTPISEVFDGLDNDCDGQIDEDFGAECSPGDPASEISCGTGACVATGLRSCTDGHWVNDCTPGAPTAEVCDGVDNNCNGAVDDGIAATETSCGIGQCGRTGMLACVAGALVDSCKPGPPATEVLDSLDNDCDGQIDEDFGAECSPGDPATEISCGTGACVATGLRSCIDGYWVSDCTPGAPTAEVCDGVDNNCNGAVDDGIAATETTCGVGECGSTGMQTCVAGAMVDSCTPGAPVEEVCDGKDNNCNGAVDDGLTDEPTVCGIGECSRTGLLTCIDGAVIDTCDPGLPTVEVCDGLDNNCNGTADDGIAETETSCGVGECGSTGILACVNGAMTDSCVPGLPAAAEVCSDGLDNDCNGNVDDGCDDADADQLAEDGLNLLIDHLQAYLISGDKSASIEDILPRSVVNDIRTNYFEAAIDIDSENPSAHFGLAVMELVNIAYDTDFGAIIDLLFGVLTGADSGVMSNWGTMTSMLFKFLDTGAADYLTAAMNHLDYAVNLSTDIVLRLYMPMMVRDESGNPVLDPETGLPQYVKDDDGKVVFDPEKSSYQLDRTDVLMIRAVGELGLGALHMYKAYDLNLADANGSYDYFDQMIVVDPETGGSYFDLQSFLKGLYPALEYNDKRDGFLTLLPGGAIEAQASKAAFLGAITDMSAALDSLVAETDDQADDFITAASMAKLYGIEEFSTANVRSELDKFSRLVNSSASNRYDVSFSVLDKFTIDMGMDLSGIFSGSITDLHQYMPYHYWFHLDQSTAYPPNAAATYSNMIDGIFGFFYGLAIPLPLYADEETPPAGEAEAAAYPYLFGPRATTATDGFIQFTSIKMNLIQMSFGMSMYFPDTTFGGIIQGLTQDDIDAYFEAIMDPSNYFQPTD